MFLTIGVPPIDSGPGGPRIYLQADRAGTVVFPLGRYQASPLDSLAVATYPTLCINQTVDSFTLPPQTFSGRADTLDVTLVLNRPAAPGRMAAGRYCALAPLPNSVSEVYTSFAIDTVRVDSVFGRFDFMYTGPFGDRYGPFVAAHRADSLIAFWPLAGCQGVTLRAGITGGDTLGPAILTTPDCQGLPDTILTFREDSTVIVP